MNEVIQQKGFLNLGDFGFRDAKAAFDGQPDDAIARSVGTLYAIATGTASKTDTLGSTFDGLSGFFEIVRAVPRMVKEQPVSVLVSKRLFLPAHLHNELLAVLRPDPEKQCEPIEFGATVTITRAGSWSLTYLHGIAPADPLAAIRGVMAASSATPTEPAAAIRKSNKS